MQSHSPMLYWCGVYARLGSSTSSYVYTATELNGTYSLCQLLKREQIPQIPLVHKWV
jgi:hypothetical protein